MIWDIIAERLGFMLVFGDLVFIPFTFSIQGWWLLQNKVELPNVAAMASCLIFVVGYLVFRGANKQKHVFKKNPNAHIWGKRPKVVGGSCSLRVTGESQGTAITSGIYYWPCPSVCHVEQVL
uniref:Uncharacterized protein n=1 Tax=Ananas comosus var. bracteatus TaxID=296719 RepID=A0A6V7Q6Q7_ANACO|nr:unnamed protein product [Ananas comosus var. bracteatus]